MIYPILGDAYMTNSSKTTIQSYVKSVEKRTNHEIDDKLQKAQQYNEGVKNSLYDEDAAKALNGADGLMCYVEYPELNIYLPVYYGTSNEVLDKGCGWLEKTSLPVGGKSTHASISGHTGLPNAEMFTRLDNAKVGDVFNIHVLDRTLVYQVDNINAVTPNDTKHLLVVPDEDYVTLLTCTPYGINDKRLLVRGKRVSQEDTKTVEQSDSDNNIKEAAARADDGLQSKIDHDMRIVIIIVIIAVVVFIAACIWLSLILKRRAKYIRKEPLEEQNEKIG